MSIDSEPVILDNLTLELSGKAFKDDSEAEMHRVAVRLFSQWKRLTERADRISVLLWIGDGSELLEFNGDLDAVFEWGYWQGIANPLPPPADPAAARLRNPMAYWPVRYRADAAPRSYRWLKRMMEVLREVGAKQTGRPIRIGATFDNGPEFAVSDFKYRRHREIATAHSIYPHSFVTCDAVLHADSRSYAGFPGGIPEGTTLGTFLGAQYRAAAAALGYDYIWLSNGMGFGIETWGMTGAVFDGARFHPERIPEAGAKLRRFWEDFFAAAPGAVVETRGSNYSAGQEIASDAAPLRWLYDNRLIAAPVNSPSSAIYGNTGLSIAGWMSHIAELPGTDDFTFRYYIHDPWFLNSPWLDRFDREPWDLYPVLSVGRIDAGGRTRSADRLALLSCDDSRGDLPDQVPDEVIPHLLEAFRTAPDAPGPLIWLYPFDEYSESGEPAVTVNEEMYAADLLQEGLPLNTVVSSGNFRRLAAVRPELFRGAVLVTPLSALRNPENLAAVRRLAAGGVDVAVYGAVKAADAAAAEWLGVTCGPELSGEFSFCGMASADMVENGVLSSRINVEPLLDGGALTETAGAARVLAEAEKDGIRRVVATIRTDVGGRRIFVRSLPPLLKLSEIDGNPTLHPRKPFRGDGATVCPTGRLLRWSLAELGWILRARLVLPESPPPRLVISRHDGAFYFNGYTPDTTAELEIATPLGVPVPVGREIRLKHGVGFFRLEKAPHFRSRALIRQEEDAVVSAKTAFCGTPDARGRMDLRGLRDAEVRFFVPADAGEVVIKRRDSGPSAYFSDETLPVEWENSRFGRCLIVRHASGTLHFKW